MTILRKNLPHIFNSCSINALFIALSYTDAKSNDDLIQSMLEYCKDVNNNDHKIGVQLMTKFYKTYKISVDYQNGKQILEKFYNLLTFDNTQFEIGYDYEKIVMDKKLVFFDYEQIKNMIEYNMSVEDKTNRILSSKIDSKEYKHFEDIKYNDSTYAPCIFICCISNHYLTIVCTISGLLIYDDICGIRSVNTAVQNDFIRGLIGIEFIGYIKE